MRSLLVAGTLLGFVACKDDRAEIEKARLAEEAKKTDVLTRLNAPVQAMIALVRKAEEALPAVPRPDGPTKVPPTDPKIRLLELHNDDTANADVMMQWELAMLQRAILGSCRVHLMTGARDVTSSSIETYLTTCAKVRYLLVVRPEIKVDPKLDATKSKYKLGVIDGDVVIFDLSADPPRVLGTFPIRVVLSRDVEVQASASNEIKQYELDEALRRDVLLAVEKTIGG